MARSCRSQDVMVAPQRGAGSGRLRRLAGVLATAAALLPLGNVPAASAAAVLWSPQTVPQPAATVTSYLDGASCTSTTLCRAVGGYYDSDAHTDLTFGAIWDGTRWSAEPTANATGANTDYLSGISCRSASWCMAVGFDQVGQSIFTLAEAWSGKEWSVQATSKSGTLKGVSCISPRACVAVGYVGIGAASVTLAEIWDGTTWSVQSSPNGPSTSDGSLNSVSCTSPTDCVAVGSYVDSAGKYMILIESWNGKAWSVQPAPDAVGELNAVSCPSFTSCTAVGQAEPSDGYAMAVLWNGTTWSVQTVPSPSGATSSNLLGMSCTARTACTAVGDYLATVHGFVQEMPLAEVWNGTHWSAEHTPNTTTRSSLTGVSCISLNDCTAVGSYFVSNGYWFALAERRTAA